LLWTASSNGVLQQQQLYIQLKNSCVSDWPEEKRAIKGGKAASFFFSLSFLKMDGRLAEMVATFLPLPYIRSLWVYSQ
jgi:hypothetical protein